MGETTSVWVRKPIAVEKLNLPEELAGEIEKIAQREGSPDLDSAEEFRQAAEFLSKIESGAVQNARDKIIGAKYFISNDGTYLEKLNLDATDGVYGFVDKVEFDIDFECYPLRRKIEKVIVDDEGSVYIRFDCNVDETNDEKYHGKCFGKVVWSDEKEKWVIQLLFYPPPQDPQNYCAMRRVDIFYEKGVFANFKLPPLAEIKNPYILKRIHEGCADEMKGAREGVLTVNAKDLGLEPIRYYCPDLPE